MITRGSTLLTAVATSALVLLTACSSTSKTTPASTSSGSTFGAPPGAKILGTPRIGEPFTFTITYSNNAQPNKLEVTVDGVTCGRPLDPAVLAYTARSVGATATATPTPESGKQYCVVSMQVVNVGNSEAVWSAQNTVSLNVGATEYTETQADWTYAGDYEQYLNSMGQVGPAFGIQPGSKGPVHGVFEIPLGASPTSLWVTSGTAIQTIDGVQPGYLVRL